MLVHMDVSDRAFTSFKSNDPNQYPYEEVIRKYRTYVQAGSPFPDWGYLCNSPAGEASHWPPFVDAYIAYLNKTYQRGTASYNKMVAFLFGVTSHIQTDVEWHWGRKAKNTKS